MMPENRREDSIPKEPVSSIGFGQVTGQTGDVRDFSVAIEVSPFPPFSSFTIMRGGGRVRGGTFSLTMPELPEVETLARALRAHLPGRRLVRWRARRADLRRPLPADLPAEFGHTPIVDVGRRGKVLIISFGEAVGAILVHLGMTGRVRLCRSRAPLDRHDHLVCTLDNGLSLRFNDARRFGWIALYQSADKRTEAQRARLLPTCAPLPPTGSSDGLSCPHDCGQRTNPWDGPGEPTRTRRQVLASRPGWRRETPASPRANEPPVAAAACCQTIARFDPPELRGLGPEPLSPDFSAATLARALAGCSAAIKTVLLDQSVVAGLGNIWAAEALFAARIHPARSARTLNAKDVRTLHRAIRATLRHAVAAGSTIRFEVPQAVETGSTFAIEFQVYGKAGEPCPVCATPIGTTRQGGRSTYFCPACQKGGRP
jgi:formamidopyrimidine-DNA glycosylase